MRPLHGDDSARARACEEFEGQPFVLLGVNGDDEQSVAAKAMDEHRMTWPSLWNGGQDGGAVAAWGVRIWPAVYVVDAKGVIRYDSVRRDALAEAVDYLIAETEATKP